MSVPHANLQTEIHTWLWNILKNDKLKDLVAEIEGNSDKGDGYMGDIIFVSANGVTEDDSKRHYDLVLKCSKRNKALRESTPIQEAFINEMFVYEKILPSYKQFQKTKGISNLFDSVPKCYGSFTDDNMEIIALENLKKKGYDLWPKTQPLTRKYVDLVIREYAKLHSTSVAFEKQHPEKFEEFLGRDNPLSIFWQTIDVQNLYGVPIDQSYEILKNDIDQDVLLKWKMFKDRINFICQDLMVNVRGLKVILHGDCWNNNFMYLLEKSNKNSESKVAFLDWQVSRYSSPIEDLSYFLFCCASKNDLENLNDILATYHRSFVNYLQLLGVDEPNSVYPYQQFMEDWKKYCSFGLMMSAFILKICSTNKDEVLDVADAFDSGKNFAQTFQDEIRDTDAFKERIRPVVEYAAREGLI